MHHSENPISKKIFISLDFYHKFRGKRIFGDHKTIRGLISGIIVAIIAAYLQTLLYQNLPWIKTFTPINYNIINPILFGLLQSLGALLGDAIEELLQTPSWHPPGQTVVPLRPDRLHPRRHDFYCVLYKINATTIPPLPRPLVPHPPPFHLIGYPPKTQRLPDLKNTA